VPSLVERWLDHNVLTGQELANHLPATWRPRLKAEQVLETVAAISAIHAGCTGTAGRTENAQVAAYLAYAAAAGAAFTGRALYLPRSWTSDPARCRAAGVPDGTAFATKPALARQMITRAGCRDPALRAQLARRGTGYVVAILPHPESSCTGPDGDDDIRPQPAPATTAEQPSTSDDHEMSLED
jgi:hypothetical protein